MKLRNKKTGKVEKVCFAKSGSQIAVVVEGVPLCGNSVLGCYDSLAKLTEDWEDHKPAEPLFTEKAARILRDWAELNGLEEERFRCQCIDDETITFVIWKMPNARGFEFDVPKTHASARITIGTEYTLDELCGEEDE